MVVSRDSADGGDSGSFLRRAKAVFAQAAARLRLRRETGPIDTVEALVYFAHTRAAFVGQKKLYGYLKARMGTRYPSMFEDEVFVGSINIAKCHVFAACLSDITVHTVAHVAQAGEMTRDEAGALALRVFSAGLETNRGELGGEDLLTQWREAFLRRLDATHWENVAAGADAFTESPAALYRWAPIDEQLKRYDREIVENSIRFAWAEVIRDCRLRLRPGEVLADMRRAQPEG